MEGKAVTQAAGGLMQDASKTGYEPTDWLLIFHRSCGRAWVDRLIPGRFKHVSALTWCDIGQVWLFYDPGLLRSRVYVMPQKSGDLWAGQLMDGQTVLRVPVREKGPKLPRFGFWCSSAIAHLLGIHGGPLPTRLYDACIAADATIVASGQHELRRTGTAGADCRGIGGG
jgi:hypothetical protein